MEELLNAIASLDESTRAEAFHEIVDALYFNSPDPIVFVNHQGHITSMNDAARKSVRDTHTGRSWVEDLVAPGYSAEAMEFEMRRQLEIKLSDPLSTVLLCQDGRQIEVEVRHRALGLKSGIAMLRLLFVRDVSTRESMARMLIDANKALSAAVASKTEFVATVSHEIRNPINGILGMSEYLRDTKLDDDQLTCARKIHASGKMLLVLVNDVLDFAKTASGKLRLEAVDYDLRQCMDETLSILSDSAFGKGVELVVLISSNIPVVVRGDPLRLRQILTNLVSNSIKFTKKGHIKVTVTVVGESHELDSKICDVRFQIEDTGIGMSDETLQSLFQPFAQGERNTARLYGGTGLGLSICKSLVEQMEGQISASSAGSGTGAKFEFTLPMQVVLRERLQKPNYEGKHVLMVSTSDVLMKSVMEIMAACEGLDIHTVKSVQEALQRIAEQRQRQRFNAVLVDSSLALEFHSHAPTERLIVLTETTVMGQLRRVLGQNVRFVSKPVAQGDLLQAFADVFVHNSPSITTTATRTAPASPSQQHPAGDPLRILVVDDNPINQQVAAMFLKRAGHFVELASTGLEAIKKVENSLETKMFDVILMDCYMPEMDGMAATKYIRKLPAPLCNVRIVALTASVFEVDHKACLEAGMNTCLTKPYESVDLYHVLSSSEATEVVPLPRTDSKQLRLDASVLETLCDNDVESAEALLDVFLVDLRKHRLAMNAAHTAGVAGMREMARIAHTLRGSSGGVGAKRLEVWCRRLEERVRKSLEDLLMVFESTSSELAAVTADLTVRLD
eukprot:TRINITY_DN4683_c0_g1_i9.p1 TRINITY_DN4683_c0_g1~~TRINITY_DN4683_c0_g1_i9.p1  ORF type:complete len:811 (+),score=178.23 TRINITY_DN4683_c0_g1_i9:65-2434(+)